MSKWNPHFVYGNLRQDKYVPRSNEFNFRFTTAAQNAISNANFHKRLLYLPHQPQHK